MYVRKKNNKSGLVSVQVIDKSTGKYKVIKTIGCSGNSTEIDQLVKAGKAWIKEHQGQKELDFDDEHRHFSAFVKSIREITVAGIELLLGKIFDEIGFGQIQDNLFRRLVLSRLCFPVSKLKTTDYLQKYHGVSTSEDAIYRYLDKLHHKQKDIVQQISYRHTLKILGHKISIVFYDVTTLYFEIDTEDELRKTGFSKEGKHQNPQIVLGLLVSTGGYPLAYELFAGNKFEGHTMLPVIDTFKQRFGLKELVVIADAGLLSNKNIKELQIKGYHFILGARIKNEKQAICDKIQSLKLENGQSTLLVKDDGNKLVISYSDSRAKKDKANRKKGLKKLEKQIKAGKLTKANINNRGYNKYLKLKGKVDISIDYERYKTDSKWDGLKGYLTNTDLSKEDIIENYGHLWKIEKAFRVSKHELKVRPIFHRLQRRIEAHICICFVAYKVYKELERQLHQKRADLSPEKAIEIAKTIYNIEVQMPKNKEIIKQTLLLKKEQKDLAKMFDF